MPEGKYIVIEGHDGTGKSTQVEMLAENLLGQGVESFVAQEPAGTPTADAIRTIIKDASLQRDAETNLLLFTAARHEIWQRAKQELALGRYVISSRNFLSTLAYQGGGEGLDEPEILDLTSQFTDEKYMNPDLTIVLSLDQATRQKRLVGRDDDQTKDTFESRGDDFQTKVNEAYGRLAEERGYPVIDADASVDEIHQQIVELVDQLGN